MFSLRFTTTRELRLWAAMIEELRERTKRLQDEVDKERKRADAAVNALLAKTQNLVLTPHESSPQELQDFQKNIFDLFGDADEGRGEVTSPQLKREADFMEKIQS